MRSDRRCAFPVVEGIPILLWPERLVPDTGGDEVEPGDRRYAEAYDEMNFYDRAAGEFRSSPEFEALVTTLARLRASGLDPGPDLEARKLWLDAVYDAAAQDDAYRHLAPFRGKQVLQLGGTGSHAAKFIGAGAARACLVSPMLGEALVSRHLAETAGMADRMEFVVGVAEELPYPDASFDAVYSGGCVHHMVTELAFSEVRRVLRPGGRFAAVEPWRAPFYSVGTALFGKRETDVRCRPLRPDRVAPFRAAFPTGEIRHHGAMTRYLLLALMKLGLPLGLETVWKVIRVDDRIASLIPGLRAWGSSVALLARRGPD